MVELLDKKELAEYLNVSIHAVARITHRGGFPKAISLTSTSRGLLRWKKHEVDEWLLTVAQRAA